MACGTCRATHALSRPLIAAEMCDWFAQDEQTLLKQLHLKRWSGCHSLFLSLRCMLKAVKVIAAAAQIKQLSLDGCLSSLHCLHIVGRDQVPLTKGNAEGVFLKLLAKHASVLTLDIKSVSVPLDLPTLQNLIINLAGMCGRKEQKQTCEALFPAVSRLMGLHTLYVQSSGTIISRKTDLTASKHLRCVALQGVELKGGVALPTECLLHVLHVPQHGENIVSAISNMVTGVNMHHSFWWEHGWLLRSTLNMRKLERLQLTVDDRCKDGIYPSLTFSGDHLPALKVLELDAQSSVKVWLVDGLALELLVIIAAGALVIDRLLCPPMTTLKQLFLRSGAALAPNYKECKEDVYGAEIWSGVKILDHVREEQGGWVAQVPASFQPRKLQQCWCGACPDCLVQAGVPILCDRAWTSEGFKKHLRPHCSGMA